MTTRLDDLGLVGVEDSADIRKIISEHSTAEQQVATDAVVGQLRPRPSLEQYGITMRKLGIMQAILLVELIGPSGEIPDSFQPFIWVWASAAPLADVYAAAADRKAKGVPAIMARVQEWFDSKDLPLSLISALAEDINSTFKLVTSMSERDPGDTTEGPLTTVKKSPSLG